MADETKNLYCSIRVIHIDIDGEKTEKLSEPGNGVHHS